MKTIPSQFQISAENRHYKMVNTSLFLLSKLKIDRKMTQRIGGELFFLLWSSPKFGKNISTKQRRSFFRFGLHLKNWVILFACASRKLKVEKSAL